MENVKTTTLLGITAVLVLVVGLFAAFAANTEQQELLSITNFDECAAAGNPIMESYPEQCRTPDGRSFVNERQAVGPLPDGQMTFNGCAVAGCSGQLCVSADEAGDVITTCEFKPEYACYREASCEPHADGVCGWTLTPELKQCVADAKTAPPMEAIYDQWCIL